MSNSNETCIVGGYDMIYPPRGWNDKRMPDHSHDFVAIAGDDPEYPTFKDCCAPYPVHFVPPCIMWCETNGNIHEYTECWNDHGFYPKASSGMAHIPNEDHGIEYGCMAVVLISAPILLFVMHMLVKRFRARRAMKRQYQRLPQSEVAEAEEYHDYTYGTLNHDSRVDNKQQV